MSTQNEKQFDAKRKQEEKDKADMAQPNQGLGFVLSNTGTDAKFAEAREQLEREQEQLRNAQPTQKDKWIGPSPQQRGLASEKHLQRNMPTAEEERREDETRPPLRGVREDLDRSFKRESDDLLEKQQKKQEKDKKSK